MEACRRRDLRLDGSAGDRPRRAAGQGRTLDGPEHEDPLQSPQSRGGAPGLRRQPHGPVHPWCTGGARGGRGVRGGIRRRRAAPEPQRRYDTATMCRLFGQLSAAHRTASEPLCSAENALRTQSHLHPHGWGIAWYGATGPRVRRGVMAAHADLDFVRAGRSARSRIVLAHVRDASVGTGRAGEHPSVRRGALGLRPQRHRGPLPRGRAPCGKRC